VIETEVAQLAGEEQAAFLADLGLAEPAIRRVLTDCYALLGLISFFTVGEDEVRAWPVPRARAPRRRRAPSTRTLRAASSAREVVGYDELVAAEGSMGTVRERGQFRLEGKEYVVQDGEICHFRFNVAK
jgi:ribosome-binding ATPase YchF (GTP1/OBG family)